MAADDVAPIPLEIIGVRVELPSNQPIVLLKEQDGTRYLPIWIGANEATAIATAMEGVQPPRPLTHDLIGHMLMGFEIGLERIIINDVNEGTYFARIILHMQNELGRKFLELDARPSDSIVLALQQKRPIFVAQAVFDVVEDMTEILDRVLKQQKEEDKEEEES